MKYIMTRRIFFGALLFGAITSMSAFASANITGDKTVKPLSKDKGQNEQIVVYYFHGKIRCDACKKTEQQSRNIIERRFASELKSKRMSFKIVNFDETENAHFFKDYKLPCPSLVIVHQKSGKDIKWKLLGDTWEHLENLPKFNEYVETEVAKFLKEMK
jgi:thiol-disulfide isomerase/thioredoxin